MTRRGALASLLLGTAALLSGCGMFGKTYRYKLTVEVDTPQGLKTGYAVREVTYHEGIKLPDSSGVSVKQRGEAVAVDLPGGQTLFALLSTDAYKTLQKGFGDDGDATMAAAVASKRIDTLEFKIDPALVSSGVTPYDKGYPRLVHFKDIRNPMSVEAVDPDNLAAAFGPGVKLRRITIQMTDEPVTFGIKRRLGWFAEYTKSGGGLIPMEKVMVDGIERFKPKSGYDASLVDLGVSDFSTEAYK